MIRFQQNLARFFAALHCQCFEERAGRILAGDDFDGITLIYEKLAVTWDCPIRTWYGLMSDR